MTNESFGSGVSLDEEFDFEVGSTGDLQTSNGLEELEKDLAMQMVISISRYLGAPFTNNLTNKISGTASRVAQLDSRVISVEEEKTEASIDRIDGRIDLKLVVNTRDGQRELVFEI